MAANATGEAESGPLRLQFDRSVRLAFQGASISSDGGLLMHRELDDALSLMDMAAEMLADPRSGKNGRVDSAAKRNMAIEADIDVFAKLCEEGLDFRSPVEAFADNLGVALEM